MVWSQGTMLKKHCHTFYLVVAVCLTSFCMCLIPLASAKAQGNNATMQILGPLQPPGFFPALLTVHVNDYVTFVNQSSPPATVTIASDNGQFSSPALAPNKVWTITLSNPGAYEFHDTATSPRMVGEIIAVPDTISLLPTPEPGVAATALAWIESGKTPPDTIALVTPTPTPGTIQPLPPSRSSTLLTILVVVGVGLLFLALLLGVILLLRRLRRRRRQSREFDEQGADVVPRLALPAPRQRRFARLRRRKGEDDDDLEDEDEEI